MNEHALKKIAETRSILKVLMFSLPSTKDNFVTLPTSDLMQTLQVMIDNLNCALEDTAQAEENLNHHQHDDF